MGCIRTAVHRRRRVGTPPLLPFQCFEADSQILLRRLRCQEDLRFGPRLAGTTGGPWEEGGSQPPPPPPSPSNTSLGTPWGRKPHLCAEGRRSPSPPLEVLFPQWLWGHVDVLFLKTHANAHTRTHRAQYCLSLDGTPPPPHKKQITPPT